MTLEMQALRTDAEKKLYKWMCGAGAAACRTAARIADVRGGQWEPIAQLRGWDDGEEMYEAYAWPSVRLGEIADNYATKAWLPIRYA